MVDIILFASTLSAPVVIVLLLELPQPFIGASDYCLISAGCGAISAGVGALFRGRPYGLSSPVGAFYLSLIESIRRHTSIECLIRSLIPYSDLSTYGSQTTKICWIFGAHI